MAAIFEEARRSRFALVTEGHRFLIRLLPFREPESRHALAAFVAAVTRSELPSADVDAVLLRCLVALSEHDERRVPSLVDRYLSGAGSPTDALEHFSKCIEDLIKYRGVSHGSVQEAIAIVSTRYGDPACTPQFVARSVGVPLSTFCVTFKREKGCTLREYIRTVRLEYAAGLLISTSQSIKEIWAAAGYNHPSNFDHDFKRRFGVTPREYRSRALRPVAETHYGADIARINGAAATPAETSVLIVDDDECSAATIGRFLQMEGYAVSIARTGTEGLQRAELAPDVVLLDYHLGDMDGLQFLQALRRRFLPGPAVALFTADWGILDRMDAFQDFNALVASKLCDLDRVKEMIAYLAADDASARGRTSGGRDDLTMGGRQEC